MSAPPDPNFVDRFRSFVTRELGLGFDEAKLGPLSDVLRRRAEATRRTDGGYLTWIETDRPERELAAIAEQLTVPETYFFRNMDQFRAFAEVALAERVQAQAARKRLSILSAGCASGEEAYSLSIQIREALPDASWSVSIRAVDVNPAALERARRARYTSWAFRETPPVLRERWFRENGSELELDPSIRSSVTFERQSFFSGDTALWQPGVYDVVFCRNVMMYFTPEHQQRLVSSIARALVPRGFLFLGHAETLRGLSQDFHLRHTHGTFYYQLKDAHERTVARSPGAVPVEPVRLPAAALAPIVDSSGAWVEAIGRASARIESLTRAPGETPRAPAAASDLARAFELLRTERFAEALESVRTLPPEFARDTDVLLLKAALLAHGGQLSAAEETCRTLLAIDELNAGAHYVLALCREGSSDPAGALDQDQVAVYLDPSFAMPRLHLGLMARRAGDHASARRELGQALVLLQREDASRLLLFGGGFTREALTKLCRSELAACGAKA